MEGVIISVNLIVLAWEGLWDKVLLSQTLRIT